MADAKTIRETVSLTIDILNETTNKTSEKKVHLNLKKMTSKNLRELTPLLNLVNEPARKTAEEMLSIESQDLNNLSFSDSMKITSISLKEQKVDDLDETMKNRIILLCNMVDLNSTLNVPDVLTENIGEVLNDPTQYKNDFWDNMEASQINLAVNNFRGHFKSSL